MKLELHELALKYQRLRIIDPGRQARLLAELSANGQREPVLVVSGDEGYVLIDGYRRVAALKRLGVDLVETVAVEMGEVEALIYEHRQGRRRKRSALEDGWLIEELMEQCGLNMEEVGRSLGRSKSWVSRRRGLVVALPSSVQKLVRKGQLCAWAAEKYLVPLARANKEACENMAAGVGGKRLSARQMRALYVGWRMADEAERQQIEENPLLYLKVAEGLGWPEEEDEGEKKRRALLDDLDTVVGICGRVGWRLGKGIEGVEHPVYQGKLKRGWRSAQLAFERLDERLKEMTDVGSGDKDGGVAVESRGARGEDHREGVGCLTQRGAPGSE